MLYLLDANIIITANDTAYPLQRFPIFWKWLLHQGQRGRVKVPVEQYEEITEGAGDIVDWCRDHATQEALLLDDEVDFRNVREVTARGYAPDLNEVEVGQVGRDSFLISYGVADPENRTVVTFETSKPSRKRANRKVPDVCASLGVKCCTLYEVVRALDFSTDWTPE